MSIKAKTGFQDVVYQAVKISSEYFTTMYNLSDHEKCPYL